MPCWLRRLLSNGLLLCGMVLVSPARGQPSDDLAAGRQLFAEALDDEEHHRFAQALEKYKRVLRIRDTVAIRYRMGSTLEGLGKIGQAVDAYASAVQLGTASGTDADIVRVSRARIEVLRPKMAHLGLRYRSDSWTDTEIRVDDEPVAPDALADVGVDPGTHVITATATGARPFRAQVTLSEGGRAEIPIALEPVPAPTPTPATPEPPPARPRPLRTIGVVTGAAGGVLIVGGLVVLALRSSAISELNDSCPNGDCPASRKQELLDTRDRALVEGPVAGALIGTGIAAVATGVVLFVMGGKAQSAARIAPSPSMHGGIVTFAGGF